MDYTKTYDDHHRTSGKLGSGSGKPEVKMALINKSGLSGSCLDYGCGWGMMANEFTDYVGVDISPIAIEYANKENPDKEFRVVVNGKLELGRRFDMAICLSVFTHATDEDIPKIFSDLTKHTDRAVIDIIHGEGGNWELMRRNVDVFGNRTHKKLGDTTSMHGVTHTYYLVYLEEE